MKKVVIPGVNGLGHTKGVEKAYLDIIKKPGFDLINLDQSNLNNQLKDILKESKKYFNSNENVFFFGGDHSISFPLVKNFLEKFKKNSKLLVFDAHFDLMKPMQEPGHEEWLRAIIEEGFNPKNILIVGVRKNCKQNDVSEIEYAKEKEIKVIYSDEFKEKRDQILEFVETGKIYVSFDIDVFDSSLILCTYYAEENGLNEDQIMSILELIKNKIMFFDLVEVSFKKGIKENKEKTIKIVQKILKTVCENN